MLYETAVINLLIALSVRSGNTYIDVCADNRLITLTAVRV